MRGRMNSAMTAPAMGSAMLQPVSEDHRARHDHRGRAHRVPQHLEVGAAHVEALRGARVEQAHADQVHDEAHQRHDQDRPARHRRRLPEPLVGLHQDGEGEHAEDHPVDERGEDLDPVVAVRLLGRRRALGEPDRDQAQEDAARVHQHVDGVGEEREAARPERDRGLDDEKAGGEGEGSPEPVLVAREPWRARACARRAALSARRRHHEPGLALADALAREEPVARLERVAEWSHRSVELGGARVHLQDREDAPVGLDEGDVERGGHVLHVELRGDLPAEVEEDQVALDLLGRRALEARRPAARRVGDLDAHRELRVPASTVTIWAGMPANASRQRVHAGSGRPAAAPGARTRARRGEPRGDGSWASLPRRPRRRAGGRATPPRR